MRGHWWMGARDAAVRLAWKLRRVAWRLRHFGLARYCPACKGRVRRFQPYGVTPRPDARCPICGSTERERAQVLLLRRRILPVLASKRGLRILHIAPEAAVERVLRALPEARYVTGDLARRSMLRLDLTGLALRDASIDFIFISHVLEHIEDDCGAIQEMHRVLRPGGTAFVEVPVLRAATYEDFSITSPADRREAFGQDDHVRICGLDYADRLTQAGFVVESLSVTQEFTPREIGRMRLVPKGVEPVSWLCYKSTGAEFLEAR